MEGKKLALAPVTGVVSGAGGAVTADFLGEEMVRPAARAALTGATGAATEMGFAVAALTGGSACFARGGLGVFGFGLAAVDLTGLAAFPVGLAAFAGALGTDLTAGFVVVGADLMGLAGILLTGLETLATGLATLGAADFAIGLTGDLTTGFFGLATLVASLAAGFGAGFAACFTGLFTELFAVPLGAVLLAVLVAAFMLGLLPSMD